MACHTVSGERLRRRGGFTLIELLVVLAIVALLVTLATPRVIDHLERAREATLRATLKEMRAALDRFEADVGRPANSLDELVLRRYLRAIPVDPITERADTWVALGPAQAQLPPSFRSGLDAMAGDVRGDVRGDITGDVMAGAVVDLRSGADGVARDGTRFADW